MDFEASAPTCDEKLFVNINGLRAYLAVGRMTHVADKIYKKR